MANDPLTIGSIVHLQNIVSKEKSGGYLNTLGWVTEIPIITYFHDPTVRALITTHTKKNRIDGSGSWQILSADPKKQPGDELRSGDKIHLLNMQPAAGYLDTFEWVERLEPFKDYFPEMRIGVFTSSLPNRGGGVSGTWTIHLANGSQSDAAASIKANDEIFLENAYPGAGFLYTFSKVGTHPNAMFQKFKGEATSFVFTGPFNDAITEGTRRWKVAPIGEANGEDGTESRQNASPKSVYRIENQWGEEKDAPWHETGVFKIGDGQRGELVALSLKLDNKKNQSKPGSHTLTGDVKFADSDEYDVSAVLGAAPNTYEVTLTPAKKKDENDKESLKETWTIGSREYQKIIRLEIKKAKGGFRGKVAYEGERPIRLKATPATEDSEIMFDYFQPDLLKGRTQKMQGVIDTTYKLLSDNVKAFKAIGKTNPPPEAAVDFAFQQNQLDNLRLLSKLLNAFYDHKLRYLMKQSFKNHRTDQTLAPLHLVRQAFQRLAADHEIIQQATMQRRWTHGIDVKNDGYFISEQAVELLIMDKMAFRAVAPFKRLLSNSTNEGTDIQLAIISYLSERTHIRHLPYTDQFVLIGVSYDRVPQAGSMFDNRPVFERPFHAFELLAIPHEVGHYIYEHGRLEDGRSFPEIAEQFAGNNPYYHWCEEIFADLYGCIVTGPLTVLSMRALLVSINRERAWKDDEHHPTPTLRVFLLNEMLSILKNMRPEKYNFSIVTEQLDDDWAGILESWGYGSVDQPRKNKKSSDEAGKEVGRKRPSRLFLHDNAAIHLEQIVNVDRVINAIHPIIIEFATLLLNHFEQQNYSEVTIPWVNSPNKDKNKTMEELLEEYNKEMRRVTSRAFATEEKLGGQKLSITIDKEKPDMQKPGHSRKYFLPDELLQLYLNDWGESGPTGGSGGTHF